MARRHTGLRTESGGRVQLPCPLPSEALWQCCALQGVVRFAGGNASDVDFVDYH